MLTILDTETTGLNPKIHEIIEFAALMYEETENGGFDLKRKIKFKIKPKNIHLAESTALKVNGYEPEKWEKAKPIEKHLLTIKEIIESSDILLGQNLIFDLRFISSQFILNNEKMPIFPKYIDTKQMASNLVKEGKLKRTSMDYMCEHFKIKFNGRAHTAIVDCERTFLVWQQLSKFTDSKEYSFDVPYEGFPTSKII